MTKPYYQVLVAQGVVVVTENHETIAIAHGPHALVNAEKIVDALKLYATTEHPK